MLNGEDSILVPLRSFKLECAPNPYRWIAVLVVVVMHQPMQRHHFVLPLVPILHDLGLPSTWSPASRLPTVPLNVRFKWDTVTGASEEVQRIDMFLPLRIHMHPYMTHSPPARLRGSWRTLVALQATPCSPDERSNRQQTDQDRT